MLFKSDKKEQIDGLLHQIENAQIHCRNIWQPHWQQPYDDFLAEFTHAAEGDGPEAWAHVSLRARQLRQLMSAANGEETLLYLKLVKLSDTVETALDEVATPDNLIPRGELKMLLERIDRQNELIAAERTQTTIWQHDQRQRLNEIEKRINEGKRAILKVEEFSLISLGIDELVAAIKDGIIAIKNGFELLNDERFTVRLREGGEKLWQAAKGFYKAVKGRFKAFRLPWRKDHQDLQIDGGPPQGVAIWLRDGKDKRQVWRIPGDGVPFNDEWEVRGRRFQGPELVVIPAGAFVMGSPASEVGREPNEGPQHEVAIPAPFAIGRYAVTFAEWDGFVEAGEGSYRPQDKGWGRDDRPVINVSWEDIQAYLAWLRKVTGLAYRLPSEAEWEYAARAETVTPFWWGALISTEQANYNGSHAYRDGPKGEYREKTVSVRSFEPNRWGLRQVHGNVWEWCEDTWHDGYTGKPDHLKASGGPWTVSGIGARVIRGGCWGNFPPSVRAACRGRFTPDDRDDFIGFSVLSL